MPQPHDVGSVLGGRYKVTGLVTTSADQDIVLDGVDQVLDRSVSILVAGADNADQMAASAREIATGERPGNVQVLDLGRAEGATYLVTNHASAADLLDLVVAANQPYVEPFYTDTLGTEIFGQERSTEPEYYDDQHRQVQYDDEPEQQYPPTRQSGITPPPPSAPPRRPSRDPATEPAGAAGGGTREPEKPRVTLWSENDYDSAPQERDRPAGGAAAASAGAGAAAAGSGRTGSSGRAASHFPASARSGSDTFDDYDEADEDSKPKFTRWLAGSLLALLIVAAAIFAVNNLGTMFQPTAGGASTTDEAQPGAAPPSDTPSSTPPADPQESETPSESATPSEDPAPPVIDSIARLVPEAPDLDEVNDGNLPLIIDGNPVTAWSSLVYANNTFGGYAANFALVVGLEEASSINEIQLEQLSGSGGNFEVLLNQEPALEGADQVAQGSFTSPSITIPVPEQNGEARTAEYVIINFTQLPRLSNSQGPYPWGIKLAEVSIS